MKQDNNIKKSLDMIIALGAASAAAVIGAGHIINSFKENNKNKKDTPLLLSPPEAEPYLDKFTKTFFLKDFIGSESVRKAVKNLIATGEYDAAIREACLVFFEVVRSKSGLNNMEAKPLIERAFGGKKPKLRFVHLAPEHVQNITESTLSFFYSIVKLFRNPIMHARLHLSEVDTIRQIALISYATEIVENNTEKV